MLTPSEISKRAPDLPSYNEFINGDLSIWQRGVSEAGNSSAPRYLADRWRGAGTVNFTMVQASGQVHSAALRNTLNATGTIYIGQVVEGGQKYANKTVTISVQVKATAGMTDCALVILDGDNGGGSGGTQQKAFTPTGALQTVEWTVDLGTHVDNIDGWYFYIQGTGVSGNLIELHDAKFELGSVATKHEPRSVGAELDLCQRYYEVAAIPLPLPPALNSTSNLLRRAFFKYAVEKRTQPTITGLSGTGTTGTPSAYSNTKTGLVVGATGTAAGTTSFLDAGWDAEAELL